MPDFNALNIEPQFEVKVDQDANRVTYTYSGYFTNGTTVRYGFGEDFHDLDTEPDIAFWAGLQNKAYLDAFPLPP